MNVLLPLVTHTPRMPQNDLVKDLSCALVAIYIPFAAFSCSHVCSRKKKKKVAGVACSVKCFLESSFRRICSYFVCLCGGCSWLDNVMK